MQTFQHREAQNHYTQEWNKLEEIDSEAGEKGIESLKDIAHDRRHYAIESAFDAIDSRPGLALKSREIATIAALTALGNAQSQLKVHIHRALDMGCTRTQVVKAILQVALCVGFAAVSQGTTAAKEVFQERDA